MCKCNVLWDCQGEIGRAKQMGPANRQLIQMQCIMGSPGGNWPRKTKGACEPATHRLTIVEGIRNCKFRVEF